LVILPVRGAAPLKQKPAPVEPPKSEVILPVRGAAPLKHFGLHELIITSRDSARKRCSSFEAATSERYHKEPLVILPVRGAAPLKRAFVAFGN